MLLTDYILYRLTAVDEHGIHPPFLFDLYTQVIKANGKPEKVENIENIRQQMLSGHTAIEITDLGAGSRKQKTNKRKISDIARTALSPAKYSRLQSRLLARFKPAIVAELGTSLGINTLYLAQACPQTQVYTFEGSSAIANIALENFAKAGQNNIILKEGNFDSIWASFLATLQQPLGYVFFDGNHRYEPTLRYFKQALPYATENTVFVFDDIYWSEEMKKAWQEIKRMEEATLTIDLFKIGIVFINKRFYKQNFILKF